MKLHNIFPLNRLLNKLLGILGWVGVCVIWCLMPFWGGWVCVLYGV